MAKFNFKKGDTVEILAGDDRGTKAEVLAVMPKKNKVIVSGVKTVKKAIKPTEENPQGGFLTKEMPIDVSNVKKVEA
jgi:large subunit ribosomal protein L24